MPFSDTGQGVSDRRVGRDRHQYGRDGGSRAAGEDRKVEDACGGRRPHGAHDVAEQLLPALYKASLHCRRFADAGRWKAEVFAPLAADERNVGQPQSFDESSAAARRSRRDATNPRLPARVGKTRDRMSNL